jgi:methyltransferase (TIGR00027 family)
VSLSRTSQAVALTRAGMSRPHTEQRDPEAQRRLCAGMAPIRRPHPGIWARTRFFELDHPATQADKASRLRAIGADLQSVVLAAADFRDDDVAAVLAAAGHDASRPTLFMCEGLLIYLDQAVIRRLLTGLRSRAAERSSLAASLATHPSGLDSAHVAAELNAGRRHGDTEPWLTVRPESEWVQLLASAGWQLASQADPREGSPTGGRSLLVVTHPG